MALKLNEKYPGRFNNPTADYPQGSFKNRTTPTSEDGSYFEQDWANDHLAFLSSLLAGSGFTANGDVDKVGASQYYSALIQIISSRATDYLNTTRIDVASSANVNLSTLAPSTRHINITGSTGIAGFTVPVGYCYFVRFAGVLTLTNSASLVTQSGANITTAAGDTCVLRATSANVVEVLFYTPGTPQDLGYRQTIQVLTGSRAINTTYTNNTGRTIWVFASIATAVGTQPEIQIDGVSVGSFSNNGSGANVGGFSIFVPNGSTYRVNGGASVSRWVEMR